jgi:hypothetical protein
LALGAVSGAALRSQTLYALDDAEQRLLVFQVDARRGLFEPRPDAARPAGRLDLEAPRLACNLGASSDGRWVFLGREGGLVVYRRSPDGGIEPFSEIPVGRIGRLIGVASRTRLTTTTIYATEPDFGVVRVFDADARTGRVEMRERFHPVGLPGGASCLALSRRVLCVVNTYDRSVHAFSVDRWSGSLEPWPGNPFALPVWTPHPTQLVLDAQERALVMNDAGSGALSVLDVDVARRELRYPRPLPSAHGGRTRPLGFRRSGDALLVAGDAGVQVFDAFLRSGGAVPLPFASLEDLDLDRRQRGFFLASGRDLAYVPLVRRTALPALQRGWRLAQALPGPVQAIVVVP